MAKFFESSGSAFQRREENNFSKFLLDFIEFVYQKIVKVKTC